MTAAAVGGDDVGCGVVMKVRMAWRWCSDTGGGVDDFWLRDKKSRSAGIEVVVRTVVGAGDGVVSCRGGVIIDIVGGTVVACVVAVYGIAVTGTVKREGA
ncbi:hypothetical protein Tco_0864466 [Tanacetum coccineum]